MPRLSPSLSGALRKFSFWIANGTVGHPLVDDIDYRAVLGDEPSMLEQAYAIFANVLELDDAGNVLNARAAEVRAAQSIRAYMDPTYVVEPPFEQWEVSLY